MVFGSGCLAEDPARDRDKLGVYEEFPFGKREVSDVWSPTVSGPPFMDGIGMEKSRSTSGSSVATSIMWGSGNKETKRGEHSSGVGVVNIVEGRGVAPSKDILR